MRILIVDHNAIDPSAQRIYEELQKTGEFECRVLIPRLWHDTFRIVEGRRRDRRDGLDVIPVPVLFPTRTHRMLYRTLESEINSFLPEILFLNIEPENFAAGAACFALRHSPFIGFGVSSWRNIDYRQNPYPYKAEFLHRSIEDFVRKRADGCVAFTREARAILEKGGFRHVEVIPPFVDTEHFVPAPLRPARPFTVGYAGRLHELKGVDTLLEALAGLPGGMLLRIMGNGPEEMRLREKAGALGISHRVKWSGAIDRESMLEGYRAMDLLVLPSRTGRFWKEQFGRVLIEAMSCGVPVIGSDSGGIPGVIGSAGLIFPEGDQAALATRIAEVAGDEGLRSRLARNGRELAVRVYGVPEAVRAYATFFRGIRTERDRRFH